MKAKDVEGNVSHLMHGEHKIVMDKREKTEELITFHASVLSGKYCS